MKHALKISMWIVQTVQDADAEGPHDMPQIWNIAIGKACNRGITFNNTQGHYSQAIVANRKLILLLL